MRCHFVYAMYAAGAAAAGAAAAAAAAAVFERSSSARPLTFGNLVVLSEHFLSQLQSR
jgi:hypothetical protein